MQENPITADVVAHEIAWTFGNRNTDHDLGDFAWDAWRKDGETSFQIIVQLRDMDGDMHNAAFTVTVAPTVFEVPS